MILLPYLAFLCALLGIALVVYALVSNPKAGINRLGAVALALYSLFAFSQIFILSATDPAVFWFFQRLSYIGTSFYLPTALSFILLFCGLGPRWRLALTVPFYLIAIIFTLVAFTGDLFFSGFRPGPFGNIRIPAKQALWGLMQFSETLCIGIIGLIVPLWSMAKSTSYRYRRICQVTGLLTMLTFALYYLTEIVLARGLGLPSMTFLCGLVNPLGVTFYLMVKYRYLKNDFPLLEQGIIVAVDRAIVLVDTDFKILKVNAAAALLCGLSPTELTGGDFLGLFAGRRDQDRDWSRAFTGEQIVETDLELKADRKLHLVISPHLDQFGDLIGSIVMLQEAGKPERKSSQRRLAGIDLDRVTEELDRLFEVKKFHKHLNLRIGDVAKQLSLTVHQLSAVLNDGLQKSFADLVNDYRVQEAEKLLKSQPKMSILEIAFEAGFNSKTQFNSVFKRCTGSSPRQFRELHAISREKSPVL